jgi:hypothetical protein
MTCGGQLTLDEVTWQVFFPLPELESEGDRSFVGIFLYLSLKLFAKMTMENVLPLTTKRLLSNEDHIASTVHCVLA